MLTPMLIIEMAALAAEGLDPRPIERMMIPRHRDNPRALGILTQGVVSDVNVGYLLERKGKERI